MASLQTMRIGHKTADCHPTSKQPPMSVAQRSYRLTIGRPEKSRVDQVIGAIKLTLITPLKSSVNDDVIRSSVEM